MSDTESLLDEAKKHWPGGTGRRSLSPVRAEVAKKTVETWKSRVNTSWFPRSDHKCSPDVCDMIRLEVRVYERRRRGRDSQVVDRSDIVGGGRYHMCMRGQCPVWMDREGVLESVAPDHVALVIDAAPTISVCKQSGMPHRCSPSCSMIGGKGTENSDHFGVCHLTGTTTRYTNTVNRFWSPTTGTNVPVTTRQKSRPARYRTLDAVFDAIMSAKTGMEIQAEISKRGKIVEDRKEEYFLVAVAIVAMLFCPERLAQHERSATESEKNIMRTIESQVRQTISRGQIVNLPRIMTIAANLRLRNESAPPLNMSPADLRKFVAERARAIVVMWYILRDVCDVPANRIPFYNYVDAAILTLSCGVVIPDIYEEAVTLVEPCPVLKLYGCHNQASDVAVRRPKCVKPRDMVTPIHTLINTSLLSAAKKKLPWSKLEVVSSKYDSCNNAKLYMPIRRPRSCSHLARKSKPVNATRLGPYRARRSRPPAGVRYRPYPRSVTVRAS